MSNLPKPSVLEFRGRLFIGPGGLEYYKLFAYELVSTTARSGEDWAADHLTDYPPAKLRKLFCLPETGYYEVVFRARLRARYGVSADVDDGYREELTILESLSLEVPDDD